MKNTMLVLIAVLFSSCATGPAPVARQAYWNPPSEPWTEAQSNADKRNCKQIGIAYDPRLGGHSEEYYQKCMLSRGYQVVYIEGE